MGVTRELLLACELSTWSGLPRRCRWCDAELTGRRTSWCSSECGDAFWSNHLWGSARHAALRRDGRKCVRCGSTVRLEVHHRDVKADGRHSETSCCHHIDGLETLCKPHHNEAHRRLAAVARHQMSLL